MKTLSAMITLSRVVDNVLKKLEQESKQYYFEQTTTQTQRMNIEFSVRWMVYYISLLYFTLLSITICLKIHFYCYFYLEYPYCN